MKTQEALYEVQQHRASDHRKQGESDLRNPVREGKRCDYMGRSISDPVAKNHTETHQPSIINICASIDHLPSLHIHTFWGSTLASVSVR